MAKKAPHHIVRWEVSEHTVTFIYSDNTRYGVYSSYSYGVGESCMGFSAKLPLIILKHMSWELPLACKHEGCEEKREFRILTDDEKTLSVLREKAREVGAKPLIADVTRTERAFLGCPVHDRAAGAVMMVKVNRYWINQLHSEGAQHNNFLFEVTVSRDEHNRIVNVKIDINQKMSVGIHGLSFNEYKGKEEFLVP